jgi:2-oxoglutarate dehydrogenase E1 component
MDDPQSGPSALSGVNAEFLEALYQRYLQEPGAFDAEWQHFFASLPQPGGNGRTRDELAGSARDEPARRLYDALPSTLGDKQGAVFNLINNYRAFGHTQARLDPLGQPHMPRSPDLSLAFFGLNEADLDEVFSAGTLVGPPKAKLRDIWDRVNRTYCGTVGVEYMAISSHAQRRWLQEAMEGSRNTPQFDVETKRQILTRLVHAEHLEKFLHTKFVGQKRFSLEGAESLIVMMDGLIDEAAELGADEVVIGMPHRGRLNALVNTMGKKMELLFAEFQDEYEVNEYTGTGDVKYHKGYSSDRVTRSGKTVHLSMSFNPSHLEIVAPVVLGNTRAKQDRRGDVRRQHHIPVVMHGDAAFAGQGINMETFNLAELEGYRTGGTIHIVVDNQVGFTTSPKDARSTLYPSDVGKMLNIPVLHVNGDDPEAALHVVKLAVGYRQNFHKDIVIHLMCYRRLGHNEADEPGFTQPLLYKLIRNHPTTLDLYAKKLVDDGTVTAQYVKDLVADFRALAEGSLKITQSESLKPSPETLTGSWKGLERGLIPSDVAITEVDRGILSAIGKVLSTVPEGFTIHPRLAKLLQTRGEMAEGRVPLDWAMGELFAYGTLVWEGFNVRFSGQDVGRGTFSHRHAKYHDAETGKVYTPLQHVKPNQGQIDVHDSPLTEMAVMGFDYGYSLADPFCLTVWEAQFGDFANMAQAIVDQFLSASEEKWLRMSGMVLLLPHGYEGQGPEHSSAKLERYLQLCASNNMQVCNVTTPAQFFHLIRRQLHRNFRKPLIVMTPKSLLRHPLAVSSVDDLIKGQFRRLLYERDPLPAHGVTRIAFCSGKVYYDLYQARQKGGQKHVALVRLEQIYPFPDDKQYELDSIEAILKQYPNAKEVLWVQEEPKNMGAWSFVAPRFRGLLPPKLAVRYVGRTEAASPAAGSHRIHEEEQHKLVEEALE